MKSAQNGNSSPKDIYPQDLPPWYEDEYYDDRDWERLPRRTSTAIRFGIFIGILLILSKQHTALSKDGLIINLTHQVNQA
ncbi:MAG: hypothetical protein Ct9H90mP30_4520 [Actinomycetota bacterium]|nr:MAG: hypothetical protein Ct9H90mP30_4520 [Actinomycetota bacterium]